MQTTVTSCQFGFTQTQLSAIGKQRLMTLLSRPQKTRRSSLRNTATTLWPYIATSKRSTVKVKKPTEPSQAAVCVTRVRKEVATAWSLVYLPPMSSLFFSLIQISKQSWPHLMIWLRLRSHRSHKKASLYFIRQKLKRQKLLISNHWTHGMATKLNRGLLQRGQKCTASKRMTWQWD